MSINEEQNRAKLIKLRKRHLIVKQRFCKSFGIQYRLRFKDMTIVNKRS